MKKVSVPEGVSGDWKIERFVVEEKDQLRQLGSFFSSGRIVPPGEYTRLMYRGHVVMSDTPDELRDHIEPVYQAKGSVLIAGLGLGVVLQAIVEKDTVDYIKVVEISSDVIQLVAEHYRKMFDGKIDIVQDDIKTWKADRFYDVAWYDIWNEICLDNYEEMKFLHRRFGKKTGWQGSWSRERLLYERRRERYPY